jgi:coiled-coil domain-containing protein 55
MSLSYGLNITKKPAVLSVRPPPAKRKTIFDDEDGPEDGPDDEDAAESIDTLGGLTSSSISSSTNQKSQTATSRPFKAAPASQYGDLSTNHATSKHAKNAQTLDPSIYDYDSIYDSLHAKPTFGSSQADQEKRPKYMSNLLAAAETRKRDQLRAKEKLLAKEREAEGDEFADKEKFVTAAYKRQQEENRKLEEAEAVREREAEERRRREGGGLKGLYKNMLEKTEKKHAVVVKAVEEAKTRGPELKANENQPEKGGKSEADLAREKGAIINEDGQVVDKRQLLNAGLNATSTPRVSSNAKREAGSNSTRSPRPAMSDGHGGRKESARERETRLFEEQLLGKRGFADDDEDDAGIRAAKSQKLEDEILGLRR